jgi:two-component system chemotaxis response regulator CheY
MALRVLVVDDSAVMRSMVVKVLHMTGLPIVEIREAENGKAGLDALEQGGIDLALVDINMPVMDGLTMLDNVRANPKLASLPVVVVSTEGSDKRIKELKEKGAAFIRKPFAPEALVDAVINAIGGG